MCVGRGNLLYINWEMGRISLALCGWWCGDGVCEKEKHANAVKIFLVH